MYHLMQFLIELTTLVALPILTAFTTFQTQRVNLAFTHNIYSLLVATKCSIITTFSIMTLSIITLSIITLSIITLSIITLSIITLSIITLRIITFNVKDLL